VGSSSKPEIVALTGDDCAMIYGALLWIARSFGAIRANRPASYEPQRESRCRYSIPCCCNTYFASAWRKTEPQRNQFRFSNIVRGLRPHGRM
jgi:hypothetical protein